MKLKPNRPIDPKSFSIYYGWILLPFAVVGVLMSMPGQTAGFSAFTEPLLELSGFTRTTLSLFYMIGTVASGFLITVMGGLLDRWGSRKMMMFASLMLGVTLFGLSFLDKIPRAFPFIPTAVSYTVLMIAGIFCLRFFGQGLLPITCNTMVGKWFEKKRGRAIGIMGVINTLVFSATPAIMAALVFRLSWQGAWMLLALIVGGGMSLLAWLFFRDTPEGCGLIVDGYASGPDKPESASVEMVTGATRGEALLSRSFWAIIMVIAASALVVTGFTFHIQAIGVQAGMTVSKAVAIFIPISFIAVPLSFISALLTERIHVRIVVTFMAVSQVVAFCAVYFLHTPAGYVVSIIALGCATGLFGTVQAAVVPKIFGRRHLGSINGVITSAMVIASALGPVFLSTVNDIFGSLRLGVAVMSVVPLITIFISIGMPEKCPRTGCSRHVAYLGVGANLGDRIKNIRAAMDRINAADHSRVTGISRIYETKPFGYLDQDNFLNCVIQLETSLTPEELIRFLLGIETELKRERKIPLGPRTIDLDILFYDNIICSGEELTIPHPRLHERKFVLVPLCDIVPHHVHPVLKIECRRIAEALSSDEEEPIEYKVQVAIPEC